MNNDDKPVLTASELIAYQRTIGQLADFPPPRTVIFAPQKSLADYVLHRYSTRRIKGFVGEFYLIKHLAGGISISTGFGVGAPVVAALTDQFAAVGVKQFAIIGMAGGLQPELSAGSLVISNKAIRGEGVSQHYLPPESSVDASPEMVSRLRQILTARNQSYWLGTVWTTDAPFRELKRKVLEYQRAGVLAVDMEAAALFAVAGSLGLSAVAMFSIADQLSGGEWKAATDLRSVQKGLEMLFDTLMEGLAL